MKLKYWIMATLSLSMASGQAQNETIFIGKNNLKIENKLMTPEVLWTFGRISDPQLSPDGKQILYGVTYYNIPENKSNRELFILDIDKKESSQITQTAVSEHGAKWIKRSGKIAFLSTESGSSQLWIMDTDGKNRTQISRIESGINDFLLSPDETKILYITDVKNKKTATDKYPDLDKTSGKLITDLMYKHWDEWVETIPHPFIADFDDMSIKQPIDILKDEPYESPMKPFGGIEQFSFSPDSKTVAYSCRKKTGKAYALSTNSDIYLYHINSKTTINLTDGMLGYDINPRFSPNGKYLAWESMERDGCESDKNRLFIKNLITGKKKDLTIAFDQSVSSLTWNEKSTTIYFTSVQYGTFQIYSVDIDKNQIIKITEGPHDYVWIDLYQNFLFGLRQSMSSPNELFSINIQNGNQTQISFENKDLLEQLKMGEVKARWTKTTDNKDMLSWVIYPPDFDSTKKYPTLLFCEGGPQSPVSQFWSYRWNMQIMAANGYIVIAPNRRGLYGFGQEWLEQISGDYGGQNMKDYLSAIDDIAQEPYVDKEHLGCVGASYGGFSVYWLAGHHNKRFKAFIAHDGMFNLEQQYLETEEMWFVNWDLGGAYWDKDNQTAQKSYANSPHLFVDKWDTPILIIHGEKDYRILASQGMAAFNAAQLKNIPSELLIFPDENHWVLKPQNGILWQRTFFEWLDKWLKN